MDRIKGFKLHVLPKMDGSVDLVCGIDPSSIAYACAMVDELCDSPFIAVELSKWQNPRSIRSNAYFHTLVGLIAEKMHIGFTEAKKKLVLEYGSLNRNDDGTAMGVMLPEKVNPDSIYPYLRWFDDRVVNGKVFKCYQVMKETKKLDQSEFNRLIEGTVQEAKELGIETMTEEELMSLNAREL